MTILMTYSVYSIRISSDMPVESEYLPLVTLYFMLCIMNTFLAFNWFLIANEFLAKSKTPKLLTCLASRIRSIFSLRLKLKLLKRKTDENSSKVSPNTELETQGNESNTSKTRCNKCDLCEKCEQKSLSEEEKKVKKELNESNVSLLNYLVWFVLLTFMVASDLTIWLLISN